MYLIIKIFVENLTSSVKNFIMKTLNTLSVRHFDSQILLEGTHVIFFDVLKLFGRNQILNKL